MSTQYLIDIGIPAVVVFLMGLVGLRLQVADFRRVLDRPRLVGAALLAQPLLLPPLAAAAGWLVGADPPSLAALVLIAACPAGVMSNAYTLLAGGNGALSVTLTAVGTALSVVVLPPVAALGLALIRVEGEGVGVPLTRTTVDLVLTVLLPVGLGMAARPVVARRARLERGLQAVAAVATLALELPGRNLGVAAIVGVQSLDRPEIAGLAAAVFVVQAPLLLVVAGFLRRRSRARPGSAAGDIVP